MPKYNEFRLYKIHDDLFTLVRLKHGIKISGFEESSPKAKNVSIGDERLSNNLSRAKRQVYDYAMCNSWTHFGTFTIDGKKWDRNDLPIFYKSFSQWLRDYQKSIGVKIPYLFVPELHKDGENWHMHGLLNFSECPDILTPFSTDGRQSKAKILKANDLNSKGYTEWVKYSEKFGFCSFGSIIDATRAAKYVTKYISKGFNGEHREAKVLGKYKKLYYSSNNLKSRELLLGGELTHRMGLLPPDYENDFVLINSFNLQGLSNLTANGIISL